MMKQSTIFSRKFILVLVLVMTSLGVATAPCMAKGRSYRHPAKVHAKAYSKSKHQKKSKNKKKKPNALAASAEVSQIQVFAKKFSADMIKSVQSKDAFKYIEAQAIERKLPKELAWLPMIESNFNPEAISSKGAVGLWQFMPATGKQFGLKQNAFVDERKDLKASTHAALTYLEYLHKKFNRDWNLALAAYNAGEGTVDRAIQKNRKAGKSTSFWSLKLPAETRKYVPKFLGVTKMAKSIG